MLTSSHCFFTRTAQQYTNVNASQIRWQLLVSINLIVFLVTSENLYQQQRLTI